MPSAWGWGRNLSAKLDLRFALEAVITKGNSHTNGPLATCAVMSNHSAVTKINYYADDNDMNVGQWLNRVHTNTLRATFCQTPATRSKPLSMEAAELFRAWTFKVGPLNLFRGRSSRCKLRHCNSVSCFTVICQDTDMLGALPALPAHNAC